MHADTLDRHEPVAKPLSGSLLLHGALAAAILATPVFQTARETLLGDPKHGSGAIGIDVVNTIPIPRRQAPPNPLANQSDNELPEAPSPRASRASTKMKPPPPDAVPIDDRPSWMKKDLARSDYRPNNKYAKNQVFSHSPQALSDPMYAMKGKNGIGETEDTPFGERYGAYAHLLQERIRMKWDRTNVTAPPGGRTELVIFLNRDGSVSDVKVRKSSGSSTLDNSALHAVQDAAPLPPFPAGFNYSSVKYILTFGLEQ